MTTPATIEPESRWLVTGLAATFIGIGVLLLASLVVLEWPWDKVGNGLQLLGLFIAALGVPVVPPWLGGVERRLAAAARAARRWVKGKAEQIRRRWSRFRGRPVVVNLTGAASASAGGSGTVTVERGTVDRSTISDRAWLEFLNDEIDSIWLTLHQLRESAGAERRALGDRLVQQRRELQAHTLSVTRSGWHYIIGGAGCTAIGIVLTIFA